VQPLAYVTDGTKLYEVQCLRSVARPFKLPERRVLMIDAERDEQREVTERDVLGQFTLVRAAPRQAPDSPPESVAG
jgi:hypothetical protein